MRKVIDLFDYVISKVEVVLLGISSVLLIAMMFGISYSVIARYFFNIPAAWTVEFSEYIMVALTFLSAAYILRKDGHVRVDIIVNAVGPRIRSVLNLVGTIVAGVACVMLFWFSLKTTIDHYQRNVILYKIISFPKYMVLLPIPLGSLFLSLRFVHKILSEKKILLEQQQGSEKKILLEQQQGRC